MGNPIILFILLVLKVSLTFASSSEDVSNSLISPKSLAYESIFEDIQPSQSVNFEVGKKSDIFTEPINFMDGSDKIRIERSAMPALKEIHNLGFENTIDQLEENNVESYGRYINSIHPTTPKIIVNMHSSNKNSQRTGKNIDDNDDSFLLQRGLPAELSKAPKIPIIVTQINRNASNEEARQSNNPDIQDIITGIVKLLNGNVNVHANTQGTRRPLATRINNRGPPRINDAQLPNDSEQQQHTTESTISTKSSPPYPFDRPEGPIRPFLTGVPLPEQIVPSMQQNYRPGFISQNRPPWQRPRPRPPINANRRPIPPYRPLPTLPVYKPEDSVDTVNLYNVTKITENRTMTVSDKAEEDNYDNVGNTDYELDIDNSVKKPQLIKNKKDKTRFSEKTPILPEIVESNNSEVLNISPTQHQALIIYSTSEKNTVELFESNNLRGSEEFDGDLIEPSLVEDFVSSSTYNKTPDMTTAPLVLNKTNQIQNAAVRQTAFNGQNQTSLYHPRPGLVLDDPEFKPGGSKNHIPHKNRPQLPQNLPPGYGEIFDITLSAIQGPGVGGSSQKQTVNIKPYGSYEGSDLILSPSGDQGFVSIDGKRTYINLFGDSTDAPTKISPSTIAKQIKPTQVLSPGVTGSGYVVAETEPPVNQHSNKYSNQRLNQRPRPAIPRPPPVRIDTCIVGDDSTCDQAQNEQCSTENGVSSCNCRPGYARRKHRDPCRKVVSLLMSMRVDRIYERRVAWDRLLSDFLSEPYQQLSYESLRAIDSAFQMTPFSDEFLQAKVNNIYQGDPAQGLAGVFVNLTLMIEENAETLRPALKSDIQKHLLGVIHRRNNNIGNSALFVESPAGSISNLQDLDECSSPELNDCNTEATCYNIWGSFKCECDEGLRDPWQDQMHRSGRECNGCSEAHCNNRGTCSFDSNGNQMCTCLSNFLGATCEIDGEVLGIAVGASVASIIIIVLTLICLVMWSRKWQREHKNAIGSPIFGYTLGGPPVKTPVMGQTPYQVTWAQIADVMANHYAIEPVASTRPSSAIFGYPNMGSMSLPMHHQHNGTLPPVPLPRLNRSNGMRTLENSSSSEEEDRNDLLNFQVPRPKSRTSNQSGIYYDVDYITGDHGEQHIYGKANNNFKTVSSITNSIPMSTYRQPPSTTYYK